VVSALGAALELFRDLEDLHEGRAGQGVPVSASVEGYHGAIKMVMGDSKRRLPSRCLDWLLYMLMTVVHRKYKLQASQKLQGLLINKKEEAIIELFHLVAQQSMQLLAGWLGACTCDVRRSSACKAASQDAAMAAAACCLP
jgi:hypothetical protein